MSLEPPPTPPPRAFSQGVGLVFQIIGGTLFIVMMLICCGSSLLNKEWATDEQLQRSGWHLAADSEDRPTYSVQRAVTICVAAGVFFGMALAGTGLGLQAESRKAAPMAVFVAGAGVIFWAVHTIFAITAARWVVFAILAAALTIIFGVLLFFALGAAKDMRSNPPPAGHEVLPPGYKIPYSHYHPDPPEVRLAAELQQRRERLAVQQKELEMLEEKLKKKLDEEAK